VWRTEALAVQARRVLLPDDGVIVTPQGAATPRGLDPGWLSGRETQGGEPTAWVCRGTLCSLPVTDPDLLEPLDDLLQINGFRRQRRVRRQPEYPVVGQHEQHH